MIIPIHLNTAEQKKLINIIYLKISLLKKKDYGLSLFVLKSTIKFLNNSYKDTMLVRSPFFKIPWFIDSHKSR